MDKTIITSEIDLNARSYILNAGFSSENAKLLESISQNIKNKLPEAVWVTPAESLHISLLDLVTSSVDYGGDKDKLFSDSFESQNMALRIVFSENKPFTVDFRELKVTQNAIIAVGKDDGSFQRIRESFMTKSVTLMGTKPPPKIIHATLCRFIKEVSFEEVSKATKGLTLSFRQEIEGFRLIKTTKSPMLEFELLKEYRLGK